jgi:hypothetical protein
VKKLRGVIGITNDIEVKPQVTPTEVKNKIEEALRRSAELDAGRVTVEVNGSTVNLYGSVNSWSEKAEAEPCEHRNVANDMAIAEHHDLPLHSSAHEINLHFTAQNNINA